MGRLQCFMFGNFEAKNSYVKQEKAYYTLWMWADELVHLQTITDTTTMHSAHTHTNCTSTGKVIKSHVCVGVLPLPHGTHWHFYYVFFKSLRFYCALHTHSHILADNNRTNRAHWGWKRRRKKRRKHTRNAERSFFLFFRRPGEGGRSGILPPDILWHE